jgi:predicted PurR-regulated permease PerM
VIKEAYRLPFYLKATILLIGLFALVTILYIAQSIIIPLVFAIIISILLHPVVNFFIRRRINRLFAIIITIVLAFIVIASFGGLLISQASKFSESWPLLVEKFTSILNQTISWASRYFDINVWKIHAWVTKTEADLISFSYASIGQTLLTVGSALLAVVLVPVYVFMILFYEPLLLDFIRKLFGTDNKTQVSEIVSLTKTVVQRYLIGLIIEAVIIATLYSATLLILGIDYAILLGIIGALINVIPYVGGFVGVALPMMIAIATKPNGWYAVYVLIIFYIIQFIDNHYIIPKIVASKVKINALFAIIVVLAGNALWGVPGMFLSIPMLAIIKLIFDHIEPLKPWGFLLGDTMPPLLKTNPLLKIKPILKKILKKS